MIEYVRKMPNELAEHLPDYEKGAWVIADAPSRAEVDLLAEKFSLDRNTMHDALDPDEVPRIERIDGTTYIFIRSAHLRTVNSPATATMLCVIRDGLLVTVTQRRPACIDKFLSIDNEVSTKTSITLLLHLLQHTFDEYDLYIKGISHRIQKIVNKMQQHKLENEDFVNFVMIDDQLRNFLTALTPMTAILRRAIAGSPKLTRAQNDLVEDIALGIEQSINSCNGNVSRIVNIREAYSTLSNNSLNRNMKTLTAATLIIALPNVIFGMYGMNISLPIQHYWWAYPAIISVTAAFVLLIFWFAKRRNLL